MWGRTAASIASIACSACAGVTDDAADTSQPVTAGGFAIAGWNLEYFGSPTEKPLDDALQVVNAATVIARLAPDVIGLQEITDQARFDELKTKLPGYDGLTAIDPRVLGGAEAYATIPYRPALLFRSAKVSLVSAEVILGIDPRRALLSVRLSVDGIALSVIVVHLYPFDRVDSWDRRHRSADLLKQYLDANHQGDKVAVVGDWNDDVDESIVRGYPTPFAQLRDDTARYRFTTQGLSEAHQASTVCAPPICYPSTIDHHLVSNELASAFIAHSAWVERPPYIADYRATTSDHYPVITRYDLHR